MTRVVRVAALCFAVAIFGCGDNLDQPPDAPSQPDAGDVPDAPVGIDAAPDAAGAETLCHDGLDNDGDGAIDCADTDCAAAPTCVPEAICNDTVDNDGDGATDCADSDCAAAPNCAPEAVCNDTIDNDGDGATDCADSDCAAAPSCLPEGLCTDGTDNDGDGATDCADTDCALACLTGCPDGDAVVAVTGAGLPQPVDETMADADVTLAVPALGWVRSAAVALSITHTYDGDVDITLASPAAGTLDLSTGNGGSGDNYTATVLSDTGATAITAGTAPFTGTYRPEQPFADLAGANANGNWHLVVGDHASGDVGTLDAATLYVCVCNGTAGCETNLACVDGADNDADGAVDCADSDCAAVAQCIPEAACDDGIDNDLDGAIDCTDSDCAGVGTCEQPEASCGDGLDNDGDGTIDCADTDCAGGALCSAEINCVDGLDNDGDGLTDCQDPGCAGIGGCELGTELTCGDGLDNDGDGAADCADSDCAATLVCAVTACPPGTSKVVYTASDVPVAIPDNALTTPGVSTIHVSAAGLVSVVAVQFDITHTFDADLDLSLTAPGGSVELSTDNGGGGDNYTHTVLLDSAATAVTAGTAPFTGRFRPEGALASLSGTASDGDWRLVAADDAGGDIGTIDGFSLLTCACTSASGDCEFGPIACRNGTDDDGDGAIDCAEPSCATDPSCLPEATCDDGVDNDFDGATDCADPDCAGLAACEAVETTCNDGFDNDADGATDCADVSCAGIGTCEQPEATCTDGLDNDADGLIDCFDSDCVAAPACLVEVDCGNGIDDDGDGAIDCADSNCATDLGCVPETDCTDGLDNDGDGQTDCLDLGCDGLQGCEHGAEVSCDDGFDNDGDGQADCLDTQCSGLLICAITTCPAGTSKHLYTAIDLPKAIPDGQATTNPAVSTVTATPGLVSAVAVGVTIVHPFDGDIDMFLAAPGGTVELSTDNGSSGDNYTNTQFVQTAATAITAGTAPFTGRFRPEGNFGTLAGTASGGAWNLRVGDDANTDAGTLAAYQLLACQCDAASGDCEFGAACTNGIDDDGDGLIDCAEASCSTVPACIPHEHACNDTTDNDGDGQTDCADADCAWACTAIGGACPSGDQLVVYWAADLPQTISTVGTPTVNSTITIPTTGTIVTTAVRFDANHTFDGDVTLDLTSPAASTVNLTSGNGGGGDNYLGTVFVDSAATAVTAGTAPFTGSYRPEVPLATFAGQAAAGAWHAQLRDTAGGDGGTWNELSIAACVQ